MQQFPQQTFGFGNGQQNPPANTYYQLTQSASNAQVPQAPTLPWMQQNGGGRRRRQQQNYNYPFPQLQQAVVQNGQQAYAYGQQYPQQFAQAVSNQGQQMYGQAANTMGQQFGQQQQPGQGPPFQSDAMKGAMAAVAACATTAPSCRPVMNDRPCETQMQAYVQALNNCAGL